MGGKIPSSQWHFVVAEFSSTYMALLTAEKKRAINTWYFCLKEVSASGKSNIQTIKNQALAYGWNAFRSTAVLADQRNWSSTLWFIQRMCFVPARGNNTRKNGWGQGFPGCWGHAGSVQKQGWQFRSLKSRKTSISLQTNLRKINTNDKLLFLADPVNTCAKECLRVMSKRQKWEKDYRGQPGKDATNKLVCVL